MAQAEKKGGLLWKSSASKKLLKEKVVLMYDEIFMVRTGSLFLLSLWFAERAPCGGFFSMRQGTLLSKPGCPITVSNDMHSSAASFSFTVWRSPGDLECGGHEVRKGSGRPGEPMQ